ncbi:unnamed protein product [Prunus brigantina]
MKLKSSTCIKNFSKTIFESNLASQERAVGVGYVAFKQPSKERLQWDNIVRMGFDVNSETLYFQIVGKCQKDEVSRTRISELDMREKKVMRVGIIWLPVEPPLVGSNFVNFILQKKVLT